MIISLVAIAITALGGYIWLTRGFYSALLNLVCTVAAGAIAFGLWETTSYFFLENLPDGFLKDSSWALGLMLPFAIAMAILRVAVDGILRANVKLVQAADYVGGGLCGAMSGLIVAGITIISMGFLRAGTDFLDATSVKQEPSGIVRDTSAFFPADAWTGKFYSYLSRSSFHTDSSLATLYPNIENIPASMRITDGEGRAKAIMRPSDASVETTYTVSGGNLKELLTDKWRERANSGPQKVKMVSGDDYPQGSKLFGTVVKFESGSFETFGQLVIGNGAVRLLAENANGESQDLYPIAVATTAEAIDERTKKAKYGRFAFDSSGFFVASKGGSTEVKMAFEFVVPSDVTPKFLYIRNIRIPVNAEPDTKFTSTSMRDSAVESGGIFTKGGGGGGELDKTGMVLVKFAPGKEAVTPPPNMMAKNTTSWTLQKGSTTGLEVLDDGNLIVSGDGTFGMDILKQMQRSGMDRKLRVERLQGTDDTIIVQYDLSPNTPGTQVHLALRTIQESNRDSDAPCLVDTQGNRYAAVGFMYEDRELWRLRYTPGKPLEGTSEIPAISTSRPDQKITLIFRVSRNAAIQYFAVGNKAVAEYQPIYTFKEMQNR
ncbi:MAG: hypothetical protein KGS45_03045 [Planctomycetes bacterium]|nr:hypothetical protein [Planctomycetota bacterium]